MKGEVEQSMSSVDTKMYLQDLLRKGFVCEQKSKDGKSLYRLTDLGRETGIEVNI